MADFYSYKLSKAHIIPLLLQYKKYPSLWDPNDKDYKNHSNRMRILKKISHELRLEMTLGQLRMRIKNLRTTYVREVNRILKSKKNGQIHKPRLAWFDVADSFLRNVVAPRTEDAESNDSILEETEVAVEQIEYFEDNPFVDTDVEIGVIVKQEDASEEEFNMECLEDTSNNEENSSNIVEYAECPQKKRNSINMNQKNAINHSQKLISREFNEDEFQTFGRHVANQLRCMPLREAIRSQNFIHNFLSEQRLKFLENN